MPSTNTDTVMPTHNARPSAASVSPASGASTDVSGNHRAGTHTAAQPTSASTQPRAVQARRSPVATNSGTAAATIRPHMSQPADAGPLAKRSTCERSRSGRKAKPSDALSVPRCAYASGHGKSSTSAPIDATIVMPNARSIARPRPAIGIATTNASTASTRRPSPAG